MHAFLYPFEMLRKRERRTEPPWPPGLETLKKALLGPRKLRHTLDRISAPYDDTLFIALALSRYFREDPGPFRLSTPGFVISCQMSFTGSEEQMAALREALWQVLHAPTLPKLENPLQQQVITQVRVLTAAQIDGHSIDYASWLARPGRGNPTWNPALRTAVTLIRDRRLL